MLEIKITQVDTGAKNVSKDKLMVLAKGATNSYRRSVMVLAKVF